MFFEGNVSAVVNAMREKKDVINSGQSDQGPRILLIGCGGVMYGCEAGGAVTTFLEQGYGEVFDWAVGVSTAAPGAAYFLGGIPRQGTTVYSEECCTTDFISLRRRYPVDTAYMDQVFRGATGKRIPAEKVFAHRTKLFIVVTNARSGRQMLCQPKTVQQLFAAIHASISIAGLSGSVVEMAGRQWIDGATIAEAPIRRLVTEFKPTHVVVFPNRKQSVMTKKSYTSPLLYQTLYRKRVTPLVRALTWRKQERFRASINWLRQECSVPYLIGWSGGTVSKFDRNPVRIRMAAATAGLAWQQLLR